MRADLSRALGCCRLDQIMLSDLLVRQRDRNAATGTPIAKARGALPISFQYCGTQPPESDSPMRRLKRWRSSGNASAVGTCELMSSQLGILYRSETCAGPHVLVATTATCTR
jgi:hypothetical protein